MKPSERAGKPGLLLVAASLAIWSAVAVWYFYSHGWLLYYGDAEAHLNIARRIFDSQTPGYRQIGTVWLPLPHVLMLPFVRVDALWRSGLAGALPSAMCFVAAGYFLFAAARRVFGPVAAAAAAALFAINPNMMYLQSTAMTEAAFAAALSAFLYFALRFRETQGWGAVIGAGVAASAGTLIRYEGWFLLPFAAAWFFFTARQRRWTVALVFCALAGAGPLYWFCHNWWLTSDPLEFYRGPYSAKAIQGNKPYPGKGDWGLAWLYYRTAVRLCSGTVLIALALAGIAAAALRRNWPALCAALLLALPPAFYLWSIHSSGTPIYVPELWPNSHYNTRYGLAALPLLAFCSAGLVAALPPRARAVAAVLAIAAGAGWWAAHPGHRNWITWAESSANSEGRLASMRDAAEYLKPRYLRGSGIVSSGGDDFRGICREAGIPLSETLNVSNDLPWDAALARPDLFMWQQWAVVKRGDRLSAAIDEAPRHGVRYALKLTIARKNEPVIEIYRRTGGPHGPDQKVITAQ